MSTECSQKYHSTSLLYSKIGVCSPNEARRRNARSIMPHLRSEHRTTSHWHRPSRRDGAPTQHQQEQHHLPTWGQAFAVSSIVLSKLEDKRMSRSCRNGVRKDSSQITSAPAEAPSSARAPAVVRGARPGPTAALARLRPPLSFLLHLLPLLSEFKSRKCLI